MFEIASATPFSKTVVATFGTFEEAEAHAKATFKIAFYEVDADVDYPASDFYTQSGEVYFIQPVR